VQVVDFKDLNKLRKLVKDKFIDTIFLMLPDTEQHQILDIINVAGHHIDYKIIPTVTDLVKKQFIISYVGALPVLTLKETPLQGFNMLMKRIFDIVIATTILLLSLPLTMIIALAIKLSSSGPLLYHQERISYNNKPFTIHKFRTMIQEAEKETGPIWAKKDDGRVTKTGHWLRKTNLDELPQLINVLKGDMSIVGPRPERPFFTEKFSKEIKAYFERHTVKPGMTGWAQVNGYIGNTSLEERIKHDVYYIQNWSLLFDLKILFLTLPFIFSQNLQFDKWRHRL
jgi:putative colanic acid biosynthesis UDP-glucose lipid carrier transferase